MPIVKPYMNAAHASKHLNDLIEQAGSSHQPIHIEGERGSAVLLSKADWKAIEETLHLSSIPGMTESIREGMNTEIKDCSDQLEW